MDNKATIIITMLFCQIGSVFKKIQTELYHNETIEQTEYLCRLYTRSLPKGR